MKFGTIAVADAVGAVLGHTVRLPGVQVLKKGRVLSREDVAALVRAGCSQVFAGLLAPDDVAEDTAAHTAGRAAAGTGVRLAEPFTGRCNLFADVPGLFLVDRARVDALNAVDPAVTLATVAPFTVVQPGAMVATLKIIPFAVPRPVLTTWETQAAGGVLQVVQFGFHRAGLILTELPGVKARQLDRTADNMRTRLAALGSVLVEEIRCPHTVDAVAAALTELAGANCAPVLISGASAIVDPRDVVPTAIEQVGGTIEYFGMPVDPGNLLLLARRGGTPVIGVPGCARSLKENGFDWVLQRLLAGMEVTGADIAGMGVGGLLADVAGWPQPRQPISARSRGPVVAGLVMAAGRSQRMGATNKLLAEIDGVPMIARVVDAVRASSVARVVVVTGHEAERVEEALGDRPVSFVHNPDYASGMSTSIRAGVRAVRGDADAALICLGDMPWIKSDDINALITAFHALEGREICVPVYREQYGNPVLFGSRFFAEMAHIRGDKGARDLIREHVDCVHKVPIAHGGVIADVDTPRALEDLRTQPPVEPA